MAEFVLEYAVLRWSVVAAFVGAAAIVVFRLVGVGGASVVGYRRLGQPVVADGSAGFLATETAEEFGQQSISTPQDVAHHESDAAHLLMCMVMLAMLVFPAGANPHAVRGVLTAMTVVFGLLLVSRIAEWRSVNRAQWRNANNRPLPTDQMVALGYHVVAAAAMLYAMSGHSAGGHAGGPAPVPVLALAALFIADALTLLLAVGTGRRHWLGHPTGAPVNSSGARTFSWAPIPHLVMDLGTAYMLIAAVPW